uniref:Putative secreted protein n=1 Tax=Anopheles darlingi TaxID=43151 RepID=A0A2M4DJ87_ANODA
MLLLLSAGMSATAPAGGDASSSCLVPLLCLVFASAPPLLATIADAAPHSVVRSCAWVGENAAGDTFLPLPSPVAKSVA